MRGQVIPEKTRDGRAEYLRGYQDCLDRHQAIEERYLEATKAAELMLRRDAVYCRNYRLRQKAKVRAVG